MMTRKFLRLGAVVGAGTVLACTNDFTSPVTPVPPTDTRVLTSLVIQAPKYAMAPVIGLKTARLEVRAEDQYGARMLVENATFSIASENPGVATVSDPTFWTSRFNGVLDGSWLSAYVNAVAPGEAVISVSWTIGWVTKTAKTTIRVESTDGWSLIADPATLTVKAGSTELVSAILLDGAGRRRLSSAGVFTAERDDVVALYYDEACFILQPCSHISVRGVAPGEATINARLDRFSAAIKVTVVP
jgi:hypothetical protein